MGRKGMKAFMKAVKTGPEDDQAEEPAKTDEKHQSSKGADGSSSAAAAVDQQPSSTKFDQEVAVAGKETRGQMVQRHKKELTAHKKHVAKLGKKNKDEAEALTKQLEDRHAAELKELEASLASAQLTAAPEPKAPVEGPSKYLLSSADDDAADAQPVSKRVSKAQKRREKQAQKETEREARIAEENAAMGPSQKQEEEKRLLAKLRPLGFTVHEIRADGHCLYRALEHQLQQQSSRETETHDVSALRQLTAQYIRSHSDDFLPFILAEEEEEYDDPQELLEAYCDKIESTAAWGGQLEIRALAGALQRHIKVHVADLDTVELGEEYIDKGILHLCYLRYAFALGEHFNSVLPVG